MLALQTATTMVQETTTTIALDVVQGTNWWSVGIAALAVVIAATVGVFTLLQGRVIRNIETREHEWEMRDRISAHIRVTQEVYQSTTGTSANWVIRLTNTGRAPARDILWTLFDNTGELNAEDLLLSEIDKLDELQPGEHFDLPMQRRTNLGEKAVQFSVLWNDNRGLHTTTRLINW